MRAWAYRHPNMMVLVWAAIWVASAWINPADEWSLWWFVWIATVTLIPLRRMGYWYRWTGGPS